VENLRDILYKAGTTGVTGDNNIIISGITADSRKVEDGYLFVAVKGTQSDGHAFIEKAIQAGASAVLCEVLPSALQNGICYIQVEDSAHALGISAANFYDNPSENLKVVGITGTNGKTTITTLLFNLFTQLGYTVGLISTVVNKIGDTDIPSTHTTPDPVSLQKLLAEMVAAGCEFCFMEVSSHALIQKRTAGLEFSGALFSNISHDHLDYHGTFKEYIYAKKLLFDGLSKSAFAIYNEDDSNGDVMVQNCNAYIKSFALKTMADYKAKILENLISGLQLNIDGHELHTKLIGQFKSFRIAFLTWLMTSPMNALFTLL
jgi:UDP-N-acetylmuramoyl-L-alanyl-D-glutamate--2,6-diaminopimelate ligase